MSRAAAPLPRRAACLLALTFAAWLGGCARSAAPGPYARVSRQERPFSQAAGQNLRMTVWKPDLTSLQRDAGDVAPSIDLLPSSADRRPMIVMFHGGAFHYGRRHHLNGYCEFFARQGYIAATADYRLAPKHPFPAAVQDAYAAVRHLRASAPELGGDPDRICALGLSAGGYLALMVALCDDPERFFAPASGTSDAGDPLISPRVQAAVNVYGPSDLAYRFELAAFWVKPLVEQYVGATLAEDPALWRRASPFWYADLGDPPVMSLHGRQDTIVGYGQSQRLHQRLRETGVPQVLVPVDAGHAWGYDFGSGESYALLSVVNGFLARTLAAERGTTP